jgi:hypothetical protein
MTDKIELVSERSEGEIAAQCLRWPVKQMTVNILRIVAGGWRCSAVATRTIAEAHRR